MNIYTPVFYLQTHYPIKQMTPKYSLFFKRSFAKVTSSDYSELEQPVSGNRDERKKFRTLIQDCLGHHYFISKLPLPEGVPLPNDLTKPSPDFLAKHLPVDLSNPTRWIRADHLTAYFLRHIVGRSPIGAELTDSRARAESSVPSIQIVDDFGGMGITVSEFIQETVFNPFSFMGDRPTTVGLGTNAVSFLKGQIGLGKSVLMALVVEEIRIHSWNSGDVAVVPLYVDFDDRFGREYPPKSLDPHLYEVLVRQAKLALLDSLRTRSVWREFETEYDLTDDDGFDEAVFLLLCRACAEAKVRFALILDNVDAYHYAYSSRSFLREGRLAQITSIQANSTQLFSRLASTDGLGAAGLAVIIACRDTVYDECSIHERPLDHYSRSSWGRTYRLEPKTEQVALSARLELIHHAIVALLHQHRGLHSFFDALDFEKTFIAHGDFTDSQRDSVLAIRDLSHHGLRSFVDFISKLKVDYDNKGEIFWRTFNNAARPMRIMYMSGLRRRFSEFNPRFPNIFLNDATVTRHGAEPINPPIKHRHTYWLRYLILKFVKVSGDAVLANEVIDLFVDRCGYEEDLVRLMLGELCSENELNCLRAETIGRGVDDRRIRLTSRGNRLVEPGYGSGNPSDPELAFNFDYLQLVIDDYLIALPAVKVSLQGRDVSWLDRIYVKADLQYLFLPGGEHDRGLVTYFKAKADATVCFLRILQAAFDAESQRFQEVFTDYPDLDLSSRFDQIFEELLKGFRRILEDVPEAKNVARDARQVCDQIRRDQRLDDFFRDYYSREDRIYVT